MNTFNTTHEITEDKYLELIVLKSTSAKEFHRAVEKIACQSQFPPNAYGFETPIDIYEEDDKYFASWYCWDSCD